MSNLLDGFTDFCKVVKIQSKGKGLTPLWPLYATQTYFVQEAAAALEAGQRMLVILKGRQQGLTTICDALTLWWLQRYAGMIGMFVSDDDNNMKFRRLMLRGMLASLPRELRYPVHVDNLGQLVFTDPGTKNILSLLLFAAAGKRDDSNNNLGRSKGLNYLQGDEVGAWQNERAVGAIEASLSDEHPYRLYSYGSTAQGPGVFKDMWDAAESAVTQRAIFIGFWRHAGYRVERDTPLWEAYKGERTADERRYARVIRKRYGVDIPDETFVWRRYQLAEKFRGDETMLTQEHPWLPEDAFVAFGEHFISARVIHRLRDALPRYPRPSGYQYEWADYFNEIQLKPHAPHDAELVIYHEPDPAGMYVLAAHPWGSSSPKATAFCCQVWRAWPDRLRLDAEFYASDCLMFRFAWVCVHLAAAYRNFAKESKVYFNLEIGWTGAKVLEELRRMESLSWGFSGAGKSADFADVFGCIHYLFRRVDSFSQQVLPHTKSTPEVRLRNLYGLRDAVERRQLEIPHPPLIDELAALRRGEEGDADQVGGGGGASEVRALTTAMAVDCWLQNAIEDLALLVAPKSEEENGTGTVLEANVKSFLGRVYKG